MKLRALLLAVLAFGVASSNLAEAQSPERRRLVVTAKVDSWTPQTGAVGTLVTINGSGFTRKAMVLVGGRQVRPVKMGSRVISFRVPASYGDGQIILRQAGSARDYNVGRFQVWADPKLNSFAPSSGAQGTRVELRGQNFSRDDVVTLGNQRLRIESFASNSLVVSIPAGATTGMFTVSNKRNVSSSSRRSFTVVAPAPFITSFSPTHGQPGTIVRITGGNYGNDIRVSYGRKPMPLRQSGNGWVDVMIPSNVRNDAPIHISSRRGGAVSTSNFVLEMPPQLGSYSPGWGAPGTRVTLNGKNFRANDRVSLGGLDCRIIQIRDSQITLEVPQNARGGAFAVHRGPQTIQSASRFDVFYTPRITNVSPQRGAPGTQVTLTGEHLEGARVYLGNVEIRKTRSVQPNQIQFALPNKATSGIFRVTTRGGEARVSQAFDVWNFPTIKRVSPQQGAVGSSVTITGKMMGNVTSIFLGDLEMPILSRADRNRIVVRVPARAATGAISWTAYGRNTRTAWNFNVMRSPLLQSFSPAEGSAGSTVTLVGENFNRSTRVFYGGLSARVLRWEGNRLTVVIPPNARKSDYLSVQGDGGGMNASRPFTLFLAPTARSFSPTRGKPGAELSIYGGGLAMDTLVQVGGSKARVLRASAAGDSLVISVPQLAAGSYDVTVQTRGLRSIARKRFAVDSWAMVSDIRPRRARIGQKVMLSGSGLAGARVFFGSIELPVVKGDRRGRKLWVTIPNGCVGRGLLTVDDLGHRTNSSVELEIDAPPPPPAPPRVHDHRKKKGPKVHDHRKKKGPKVHDHRRRRDRR